MHRAVAGVGIHISVSAFGWRRHENDVVSADDYGAEFFRCIGVRHIFGILKNEVHVLIEAVESPPNAASTFQLDEDDLVQALLEYLRSNVRHSKLNRESDAPTLCTLLKIVVKDRFGLGRQNYSKRPRL